jgi:fatty acid desaturase
MIIRDNNQDNNRSFLNLSGIVNEVNIAPKVTWDLKSAAKMIRENVSKEELRDLHKAHWVIDALLIVLAFSSFIGSWILLANLDFGLIWFPIAFFQSIILNNFFYAIRHDTFHHRQLGGPKVSYFFGVLLSLPMMNSYTRFLKHADHHVHVGYDLFEEHIAELDTPLKRWLSMTFPGVVLMFSGRLKTKGTSYPNAGWQNPQLFKKAQKIEGTLHIIWFLGIVICAIIWPYQVLVAYLIPYIIFGPLLFSIKAALQHTEADVSNPLHTAVFVKNNLLMRLLYSNSLGEIHLMHHIFPRIPFWKSAKAAKLFRPILKKYKVPERGFWEVLKGYYIKGNAYRKPWG